MRKVSNNHQVLENHLHKILNPVNPKKKYMQSLYHRLTTEPEITVEYPKFPLVITIASIGLFCGALLIWLLSHLYSPKSKRKIE